VTTTWPDGSQTTTSETTATTASPAPDQGSSPEQSEADAAAEEGSSPEQSEQDAAAEEGARQEKIAEARADLALAVGAFGAAITAVSELGLNPLEELTQAGFDTGLGTLPDVSAETPPNQLPPV
jgi:hypothetical protein